MWVFLNDSFLSIVEDRSKLDDRLLVRARFEGDIERAFPRARVSRTPEADYPYRASLPRKVVARRLAEAVEKIDYPSFKDSIPDAVATGRREAAYFRVWADMQRAGDNATLNRGGLGSRAHLIDG